MEESSKISEEYFKQSVNCQLVYYKVLLDKIPFRVTDHVFEIGCGTGAMSAHLAKAVVSQGNLTACDPVESRIRFANENFSMIPNLKFMHATGSVALEGTRDMYDIIISNAVLHWMNDRELENTMSKTFSALKRGGITAHSFIEDIPNTFNALGRIDGKKLREFSQIIFPIQQEKFAELAKKVGFIVLDSERKSFISEHETEGALRLIDAATYGKFEWEKTFYEAKEKGIEIKFDVSENGKVRHISKQVQFILQKP